MIYLKFSPTYSFNGSSFQGPKNPFIKNLEKIAENAKHILSFASFSDAANFSNTPSSTPSGSFKRKWRGYTKRSALIPGIVVIVFVLFAVFMIGSALRNSGKTTQPTVLGSSDKIDIQKAKAAQTLDKSYEFSIKDGTGVEVSKLKFTIQNVELRDQIVVKGQKATSIAGRTFLIVNMKITNTFGKPVQINSRDYIRLMVNNADEKLAPDIHNDPVEIQAISTKYTRVGFPINDTDTNLTLQVGEIAGKKDTIKLDLK